MGETEESPTTSSRGHLRRPGKGVINGAELLEEIIHIDQEQDRGKRGTLGDAHGQRAGGHSRAEMDMRHTGGKKSRYPSDEVRRHTHRRKFPHKALVPYSVVCPLNVKGDQCQAAASLKGCTGS